MSRKRVLVDECFPRTVARRIEGHVVRDVRREDWAGLGNGELLRALTTKYDVLLTTDSKMEHQQRVPPSVAVICVRAKSNDVEDVMPLLPQIQSAISYAPGGRVTTIRPE